MKNLIDSPLLQRILSSLSKRLERRKITFHLLVGGAGAMVGAYNYPDSTTDVDAVPLNADLGEIAEEVRAIAEEFQLPGDWLNPHYSTFTIYLPKDYRQRCQRFFETSFLKADALGPEDLMIMKLMAGRTKDQSHILFLLKQPQIELSLIEKRLEELTTLFPKEAKKALMLFDELTGEND